MSASAEVYKKIKAMGCKITEQRRIIIDVLIDSPGHHTAEEIFAIVKRKNDKINFSTIYRNLELLTNLDVIDKLTLQDGVSRYELSCMYHHHHFICKNCGHMDELDICPYNEGQMIKEMSKKGFKATEHKFEIYGYCQGCIKD